MAKPNVKLPTSVNEKEWKKKNLRGRENSDCTVLRSHPSPKRKTHILELRLLMGKLTIVSSLPPTKMIEELKI